MAGLLILFGWRTLLWFRNLENPELQVTPFTVGAHAGWQLAITLGLALVAFIFSRFVAGMAANPVWANLRGGAGHMVGNALVLLSVAVGIAFQFFENPGVIRGIAIGLAVYMLLVAAEIHRPGTTSGGTI